jgi:FMN-dependent NADH-azoreductase
MEKMLVINAHPRVDDKSSVSLQVLQHFLTAYRKLAPEALIEHIDLYRDDVPAIDHVLLDAWEKTGRIRATRHQPGQELTAEEARVAQRMEEILQQFKSAKTYVIAMPLHNFNVPSKLKDYMDNILIARETFAYTENGSVGLLTDGRKVLVIQSSDGIYTNNDWYTEVEYSHKYLKSMFNFIGIEDYRIIRAQGNISLPREEILEKAYREAEEAAAVLA